MVFFNDPLPCDDAPARAVRMAVAMRDAGPRLADGVAAAWATTSASASASRRATRRSGRIGFEGRYDYAAIGSVTNLAARLCDDAGPWPDPGHPARLLAGRTRGRGRRRRRADAARVQPPRRTSIDVKGLDARADRRHDRRSDRAGRRADASSELDEDAAVRAVRRAAGSRMGAVWDAMRLNQDDESVVVVPSITLDRASGVQRQPHPGLSRSDSCSSCCCCVNPVCG